MIYSNILRRKTIGTSIFKSVKYHLPFWQRQLNLTDFATPFLTIAKHCQLSSWGLTMPFYTSVPTLFKVGVVFQSLVSRTLIHCFLCFIFWCIKVSLCYKPGPISIVPASLGARKSFITAFDLFITFFTRGPMATLNTIVSVKSARKWNGQIALCTNHSIHISIIARFLQLDKQHTHSLDNLCLLAKAADNEWCKSILGRHGGLSEIN